MYLTVQLPVLSASVTVSCCHFIHRLACSLRDKANLGVSECVEAAGQEARIFNTLTPSIYATGYIYLFVDICVIWKIACLGILMMPFWTWVDEGSLAFFEVLT